MQQSQIHQKNHKMAFADKYLNKLLINLVSTNGFCNKSKSILIICDLGRGLQVPPHAPDALVGCFYSRLHDVGASPLEIALETKYGFHDLNLDHSFVPF
jgi:hypothetical protein